MSGLTRSRLLRRSLRHRRTQSIVVTAVAALITAVAVFAPWYTRMVDDALIKQAFAAGGSGGTIEVTGPSEADVSQTLSSEDSVARLLEDPVYAWSTDDFFWLAPGRSKPIVGAATWREDVCSRLTIQGSCPKLRTDDVVEILMSSADAKRYEVAAGADLDEISSIYPPVQLHVSGIYQVRDGDDPYWYGLLPTGRSGFRDLDTPASDDFIMAKGAFDYTERVLQWVQRTRVDPGVRATDRGALTDLSRTLERQQVELGVSASTSLNETLAQLDASYGAAATTVAVTLAQIALLAVALLAMLAGLVLTGRRPEIGLARLRGTPRATVARGVTLEWSVLVAIAAVVGALVGAGAALVARAVWLPASTSWHPPLASLMVGVGASLVAIGLFAWLARSVTGEPVPSLLRTTGERGATDRGLLGEAVALTVVACAIAASVLSDQPAISMATPALLAVGVALVGARAVSRAAARLGVRWLRAGRTAAGLTALMLARGRGFRAQVVVVSLATAFLLFGTQYLLVGHTNRQHRDEIEAGAQAVATTVAPPLRVARALDQIDPDRKHATVVVHTRRNDAGALRGLFVEPDAFRRIAFGTSAVAPASAWAQITAPATAAPTLTGNRMQVTLAPHELTTASVISDRLQLVVDYVGPDGRLSTAEFRDVRLVDTRARTLTVDIDCAETCELLRLRVDPVGSVSGEVTLTDIATIDDKAGVTPLDLGPTDSWRSLSEVSKLPPQTGVGTAEFNASGGIETTALPDRLPVLLAQDRPSGTDLDDPTLASPEGEELRARVVQVAEDAIPRDLRDSAIADLNTALRSGEDGIDGSNQTEIWYADASPSARQRIADQLADLDITVLTADTLAAHEQATSRSAEALSARPLLGAALGAGLLAALALVVSLASGWRSRSRDLSAMRMVGVEIRPLRRAAVGVYLGSAGLGVLCGAVAGLCGYLLAIRDTPLFADPEPAIKEQLAPAAPEAVAVIVGILALLILVSIGCGRWLMARSDLSRIRESE